MSLSQVSLRSKFKEKKPYFISLKSGSNQNKKIPAFVGIFKQNRLQISIVPGFTLFLHHLHSTILCLAQPGLSVESVWLR